MVSSLLQPIRTSVRNCAGFKESRGLGAPRIHSGAAKNSPATLYCLARSETRRRNPYARDGCDHSSQPRLTITLSAGQKRKPQRGAAGAEGVRGAFLVAPQPYATINQRLRRLVVPDAGKSRTYAAGPSRARHRTLARPLLTNRRWGKFRGLLGPYRRGACCDDRSTE